MKLGNLFGSIKIFPTFAPANIIHNKFSCNGFQNRNATTKVCTESLGSNPANDTGFELARGMDCVRSCAFFLFMRTQSIVRVPTQTRRKASRRRFPPCNLPIRFRFHPPD